MMPRSSNADFSGGGNPEGHRAIIQRQTFGVHELMLAFNHFLVNITI